MWHGLSIYHGHQFNVPCHLWQWYLLVYPGTFLYREICTRSSLDVFCMAFMIILGKFFIQDLRGCSHLFTTTLGDWNLIWLIEIKIELLDFDSPCRAVAHQYCEHWSSYLHLIHIFFTLQIFCVLILQTQSGLKHWLSEFCFKLFGLGVVLLCFSLQTRSVYLSVGYSNVFILYSRK